MWNQLEYRALEGFVYAVTPFNFTSIAANLPTAPALMGNTVVWKPASSAMFSAHYLMQLLEEAGLPPGVINFVAGDAGDDLERRSCRTAISPACTSRAAPRCSTACGRRSARRSPRYRSYPRIVGETGGKDFIVAHPSADPRGAGRGDRSRRLRVPGTEVLGGQPHLHPAIAMWNDVRDRIVAMIDEIKMGDVRDFRNFMGAVIDKRAFDKISGYIETRAEARRSSPAARATRARATSSGRRSSKRPIPPTARCARRSSVRSSRPTCTTMTSGARR